MNLPLVMSTTKRQSQIAALRESPSVDVLVVGGGINGIGTYRELALQGLRVVLVEQNDFCSGASAALSRMIHGGLRYMENGEFELVRESLRERDLLLKNAPHYVAPLATTIPIFDYTSGVFGAIGRFLRLWDRPTRRGALIVKTGLSLYDWFTRKGRVMPRHAFRGKSATKERWPDFNPAVKCSATYYDAWISYPERLGLELVRDTEANSPSAFALNYVAVDGCDGQRVLMTDRQTQERLFVTPKLIVNATGAWIDFTNGALSPPGRNTQLVSGTKGSHLVIRNQALLRALGDQMVYYENQEKRVCILFAYFDSVLVGSTDLRVDDPGSVRCEAEEEKYILDSLALVFPKIEIRPSEILYRFSGVRPLFKSDTETTAQISRDHFCKVLSGDDGFVTPVLCMIGGKWTTFRAFSELAADRVLETLGVSRKRSTRDLPIGGGRDFPKADGERDAWISEVAKRFELGEERVRVLVERYGTIAADVAAYLRQESDRELASLPSYSRREIEYMIDHEHVVTLGDILLRRTSIVISGAVSLGVIDEVTRILAEKRGWDESRSARERSDLLSRLAYFHGLTEDTLRLRDLSQADLS